MRQLFVVAELKANKLVSCVNFVCCGRAESEQARQLRLRIKEQREKNLTLSRLNVELNSELQEVMEQRIALEIQMEHLRPFSGGYA